MRNISTELISTNNKLLSISPIKASSSNGLGSHPSSNNPFFTLFITIVDKLFDEDNVTNGRINLSIIIP